MHSKFTILYDLTDELNKAQELPFGSTERERIMDAVRQRKFGGESYGLEAVFKTIFSSSLHPLEQFDKVKHFVDVYNRLKEQSIITQETEEIFTMAMGAPCTASLEDTAFFKNRFQDKNKLLASDINGLRSAIYRAELTLCTLGAEFCLTIPTESAESDETAEDTQNTVPSAHDSPSSETSVELKCDGKPTEQSYDDFWKDLLDEESPLNPLDLPARTLGHYVAYRLRTNRLRYLTQTLHGLSDEELAKIPVRYGALDTAALIEWLFGKKDFSNYERVSLPDKDLVEVDYTVNDSEAAERRHEMAQQRLKSLSLSYDDALHTASNKLAKIVSEIAKSKDHQCWMGLLCLEFGERLGSAAEMTTYCDVAFNDPYSALQRKVNNALIEISNQFLKD